MMATVARCANCNSVALDHCASPTCPWVKCPTDGLLKLTAAEYVLLRKRKAV